VGAEPTEREDVAALWQLLRETAAAPAPAASAAT
jgi:hypothetical protein